MILNSGFCLLLQVSNNPIGSDGALDIVDMLMLCPNAGIRKVDIHVSSKEASETG